jgi:hypothetical protein
MPAAPLNLPAQTPPLWPGAEISYATAQLLMEFPKTDPHAVIASVNSAAEAMSPGEGCVLLMRRARETLRQSIEERLRARAG